MKSMLIILVALLIIIGGSVNAQHLQKLDTLKLNAPNLDKGMLIMQALKNRKSTRELSDKKLSLEILSELLWAANGINREDGKRTAPAALNIQAVDIYVVLQEGVYQYEPVENQLIPIAEGDFRKQAGMQDFVFIAPVNLVYVVDLEKYKELPPYAANLPNEEKVKWALIAAGCQAQNVNLYCASEGLGATVRGLIDQKTFGEILKLRPEQKIILAQTVGYPK